MSPGEIHEEGTRKKVEGREQGRKEEEKKEESYFFPCLPLLYSVFKRLFLSNEVDKRVDYDTILIYLSTLVPFLFL